MSTNQESLLKAGERQCVLIIDDTPVQLVVLGRILSSSYDVRMAKTGEEGLKLAKENNIDLILLDLYMPDMSGFEVLSQLKRSDKTRHIPVILITSSASNEDEAAGLVFGAVDYIRKPFTEVVVKLRVEIHLRLIAQMKLIENLSLTDALTGINNRRSFDQMAKLIWSHARRTKDCFSMIIIDIDNFKDFNQKYDHINGDNCLRTVADTISSTLTRESDNIFRWGGEEFIILMPGTNLEGARFMAENIRKEVAATQIHVGNKTTFVTVSAGVGTINPVNLDFEQDFINFFESVDKALYKAKDNGRNRVEVMEEEQGD